jgi:ubiquinone/menaquinone biosynthesis C-methylase UbiE
VQATHCRCALPTRHGARRLTGSRRAGMGAGHASGRLPETMIDAQKLSNWYDFQAPLYRLWRDDYDGPLVLRVGGLLRSERLQSEPMAVLDAGCGTGMFALGLGKRDAALEIQGIDGSEGMLKVARRQAQQLGLPNVSFARSDVTVLPQRDASFAAVVAAGLFPNINDAGSALREFWRVLQPGGTLIVVEFDRSSMGPSLRAFFRAMIFGYRLISSVVPRFRFAEGWNIERSTVDRARFESELRAAGFFERELRQEHNHLIFHYAKGKT